MDAWAHLTSTKEEHIEILTLHGVNFECDGPWPFNAQQNNCKYH